MTNTVLAAGALLPSASGSARTGWAKSTRGATPVVVTGPA